MAAEAVKQTGKRQEKPPVGATFSPHGARSVPVGGPPPTRDQWVGTMRGPLPPTRHPSSGDKARPGSGFQAPGVFLTVPAHLCPSHDCYNRTGLWTRGAAHNARCQEGRTQVELVLRDAGDLQLQTAGSDVTSSWPAGPWGRSALSDHMGAPGSTGLPGGGPGSPRRPHVL